MARGRKSGISINWTRVEELVQVLEYQEDSKVDAKRPHKKGEKYERVVLNSLKEVNEVFSGKESGIYKIIGQHLTTQRELRKADPDASYKKAAKPLIKDSQFFETFGLKFADKAEPTGSELQAAADYLKGQMSKK